MDADADRGSRSATRILASVNVEFDGEIWVWEGPSPWHFITVPEEESGDL